MAAITFRAAQRGTRLQALVAGLARMLDAFVSLPDATGDSGGRTRSFTAGSARVIVIEQHAMIAVPLTGPDLSPRQEPGRSTNAVERMLPADEPKPSLRRFNLSTPTSSAKRSRHFLSDRTAKESHSKTSTLGD